MSAGAATKFARPDTSCQAGLAFWGKRLLCGGMPPKKGQRQARGLVRQDRILDAAYELFVGEGVRSTTIAAIADRVGAVRGRAAPPLPLEGRPAAGRARATRRLVPRGRGVHPRGRRRARIARPHAGQRPGPGRPARGTPGCGRWWRPRASPRTGSCGGPPNGAPPSSAGPWPTCWPRPSRPARSARTSTRWPWPSRSWPSWRASRSSGCSSPTRSIRWPATRPTSAGWSSSSAR